MLSSINKENVELNDLRKNICLKKCKQLTFEISDKQDNTLNETYNSPPYILATGTGGQK